MCAVPCPLSAAQCICSHDVLRRRRVHNHIRCHQDALRIGDHLRRDVNVLPDLLLAVVEAAGDAGERPEEEEQHAGAGPALGLQPLAHQASLHENGWRHACRHADGHTDARRSMRRRRMQVLVGDGVLLSRNGHSSQACAAERRKATTHHDNRRRMWRHRLVLWGQRHRPWGHRHGSVGRLLAAVHSHGEGKSCLDEVTSGGPIVRIPHPHLSLRLADAYSAHACPRLLPGRGSPVE